MKKILFAVMALALLANQAIAANHYGLTALIGGGAGALDSLDITGAGAPNVDNLADGDSALVTTISGTTVLVYWYIFDLDGTTAESSPTVIRPDDYATQGVWRLAVFNANAIPDISATYQPLEATLTDIADGTIAENLVNTANPWAVNEGGSGAATFTDGGLLVGAGTGAFEALAVGLTTQVLVGGGAGTNPAWGTDLPTAVTIGSGYIYRAGGTDVPDADVADNITVHFNGLGAADGAGSFNLGAYQHLFDTNVDTSAFRVGLDASYFEVVNSGGTDVIVRLVGSNITANLGTFTVSTDAVHAQTGTTADDDLYLAARDVDGAAYVNMITLKAGNEPYAYIGPQANGWRVDQTGAVTRIGTASLATVEVDRIPITAFTDGAAPPEAATVISSADGRFNCRAFAGITTDEYVFFTWKAPADIDATQGIKFSVSGVVGAATAPANTEVIAFSLAGVSIGNSDAAGSIGTAQTSSLTADATYAQYDSLDTAFSSAITVTNLAAGETVSLKLIRLATTTDTYAQDFHPHTILIKYVSLNNASF